MWPFRRRRPATAESAPSRSGGQGFVRFRERRHLAGMPYMLPKDEREINRLDFQHFMFRHAMRGNYLAPLSRPRDILDVGCGTGRWAMEMAHAFPEANVIGLDVVAPPQDDAPLTELDHRPENYVFVQGNALERLNFPDAAFDFTHMRLLYFALPAATWPNVVAELRRVTRPGGWVELVEGDVSPVGGPAMAQILRWTESAGQQRGIDLRIAARLGSLLHEAGLARVRVQQVPIPMGKHGGRLGVMMETNAVAAVQGFGSMLVGSGVASAREFEAAVQGMREEIARGRLVWNISVADGQRA